MIDLYFFFLILFGYLIVALPSISLIISTKFLKKVNGDIYDSLTVILVFLCVMAIPFYFLYKYSGNKCFGCIAGFAVGNILFILGYLSIRYLLDLIKEKGWSKWLKK